MKTTGAIAGKSETGRKKFTARQWEALIGFCGVETRKQVQNIWKQIEKACDATEVCTIVVTAIKEEQIEVNRQSIRVWFGNGVAEDIFKCRSTYGPMSDILKTNQGISFMVLIHCITQEIWIME